MGDVTLLFNYPLSEHQNAAWNVMRTAHGMNFSYPTNGVWFNTGNALPPYAWQEPNTGIVIIKPTFFTSKRFDPAAVSKTWFIPGNLNYGSTSQGGSFFTYFGSTAKDLSAQSDYVVASPKLVTLTDTRLGLTVNGNIQNFINRSDYSDQSFVWSMQTQVQLQANQAWSVLISPSGIPPDFADTYILASWGQKFIMEITMAGFAQLLGDVDGNGTYVQIDSYTLRDGGVNFKQAFQVSVIPLGKRFLSVTFTQSTAPGVHGRAASYASKPESFLTVLRGQGPSKYDANNLEPVWDSGLNQWVKYPADFLTLGLVANDFDYHILIAQGFFVDPATIWMAREFPPEAATWVNAQGVVPYTLAFQGQTEAGGGAAALIDVQFKNGVGATYVAGNGQLVSQLTLSPSQNGIYTPELHAFGTSYPANISTPAWTPVDASAAWVLIRFVLTTDLNSQRVEIKLLDDANWLYLMKLWGPCRLIVQDNSGVNQIITDFYAERSQPVVAGPSLVIDNQLTFMDAWDRLNNQPLLIETVLEGDLVAVQFAKAIMDAGFTSGEVFIDYGNSPELSTLTFGKFTNPNDLLRPNSNSSCGDFIRNVSEKLGVQFSPPIRVRWIRNGSGGMWWRIYLGPIYGKVTNYTHGTVQNRFFLDDSLVSTNAYGSQQVRYQSRDFIVTGNPEWTIVRPEFNSIYASSAKGVDGKEGNETRYIPAPSRVINDPTYIGFEGAERIKQLATEDLQIAQTANSVEIVARQYYEQNYNLKRLRHQEFSGEWQPEVDVDQFVVIIGRAKQNNSGQGYSAGDPISYGAYRIEHIDVEVRHDFPDPESGIQSRYEWNGSYTLTYVGPYVDAGFTVEGVGHPLVMWTAAANLPDDYDLPP